MHNRERFECLRYKNQLPQNHSWFTILNQTSNFFFFLGLVSLLLLFFIYLFLDKFVLKIWISGKMSYFVGILSVVGDIFLLSCPQVFTLLNVRFKDISELHKSLVQREESSYR